MYRSEVRTTASVKSSTLLIRPNILPALLHPPGLWKELQPDSRQLAHAAAGSLTHSPFLSGRAGGRVAQGHQAAEGSHWHREREKMRLGHGLRVSRRGMAGGPCMDTSPAAEAGQPPH